MAYVGPLSIEGSKTRIRHVEVDEFANDQLRVQSGDARAADGMK